MSGLTPDLVRAYWAFMTGHFGASVARKESTFGMKVAATALGQLNIVDGDDFLHHYPSTFGRQIFTPFEVGKATLCWSLWSQILVCAHECQHVVQYDRLGALRFGWRYVTSPDGRARLEAEAYRCQIELQHWRTGEILTPEALAKSLKSYAVTDADVAVAQTALAMSAASVRRGAVINPTSRATIQWLTTFAPELRTAR